MVKYRYAFSYLLLTGALLVSYWNSFDCAWVYDDFPFIVGNSAVRMVSLDWDNIGKALHGYGSLSRSLAFLTFGLNYYFSEYNIFYYHLTNFMIHLITSIAVFHLILITLKLDWSLSDDLKKRNIDIALFASVLWALSPLHIMAVTGIWQRVCSLSSLFCIISLYCYIRFRLSGNKNAFFIMGCIICFVISLFVKENSAMLPVSIFFYEFIFFQKADSKKIKPLLPYLFLAGGILFLIASFYLNFSSILKGYDWRFFTPKERLLTEPRILLFYISLIFYPDYSRLAVLHDVDLSTSLLTPWTTIPSILIIICLVGAAFWKARKYPLFAYAVIFYFLNHLIEGSIIPIELIYEHRNYLPSIFLYSVVSICFLMVLKFFERKKIIVALLLCLGVCFITSQGHTVYQRNKDMKTQLSMWLANFQRMPRLSSVAMNIANEIWNSENRRQEAYPYLDAAEKLNRFNNRDQKGTLFSNIGKYYLYEKRDFYKAAEYFEKAIDILPFKKDARRNLIRTYLYLGDAEKARDLLQQSMQIWQPDSGFAFLKGLLLLKTGQNAEALNFALDFKKENPSDTDINAVIGEVCRRTGAFRKAIHYFEELDKGNQSPLLSKAALIELYYRTNSWKKLSKTVNSVLCRLEVNLDEYISFINRDSAINAYVPDKSIISVAVSQSLQKQVQKIEEKAIMVQ